jgi:hypothetical protein
LQVQEMASGKHEAQITFYAPLAMTKARRLSMTGKPVLPYCHIPPFSLSSLMQFPFHYPRNKIHIIQLVILVALGLALLLVTVLSLQQLTHAREGDILLFSLMAACFGFAGIGICWFSFWYYRKMKAFYAAQDWYGITLENNSLHCRDFDVFRIKDWRIDLAAINSTKETFYKGAKLLVIKTGSKQYYIRAALLAAEDYGKLLAALKD